MKYMRILILHDEIIIITSIDIISIFENLEIISEYHYLIYNFLSNISKNIKIYYQIVHE